MSSRELFCLSEELMPCKFLVVPRLIKRHMGVIFEARPGMRCSIRQNRYVSTIKQCYHTPSQWQGRCKLYVPDLDHKPLPPLDEEKWYRTIGLEGDPLAEAEAARVEGGELIPLGDSV